MKARFSPYDEDPSEPLISRLGGYGKQWRLMEQPGYEPNSGRSDAKSDDDPESVDIFLDRQSRLI